MTPKYLNKILAPLQSQVSDKLSKYVQRDVADMDRIWWDIFVESWQRNRDYEALYDPPYPERGALWKYKHQEVCRPSGGRRGGWIDHHQEESLRRKPQKFALENFPFLWVEFPPC